MAQYRYTGPHPVPDEDNEIVHPGDVCEFDAEPAWGPWERVPDPEPAPEPPAPPAPFLAPPVTPEGM